jgi:hypothetical protein
MKIIYSLDILRGGWLRRHPPLKGTFPGRIYFKEKDKIGRPGCNIPDVVVETRSA